jgi:uncharacterized repeat protein (TIGR01451 family)
MVSVIRRFCIVLAVLMPVITLGQDSCEGVVIRQSTSPGARPGDELEYRISVHHSGSCPIGNLEVTDYLPQDAEWLGADPVPDEIPSGRREGNEPWPVSRVKWVGRSLGPNETIQIRLRARVPEMKTGWMRNTVCVSGANLPRRCGDIETFVRRD